MKWFRVPRYRHQLIFGQYFQQEFCLIVKVNAWCTQKVHIYLNKPAATRGGIIEFLVNQSFALKHIDLIKLSSIPYVTLS